MASLRRNEQGHWVKNGGNGFLGLLFVVFLTSKAVFGDGIEKRTSDLTPRGALKNTVSSRFTPENLPQVPFAGQVEPVAPSSFLPEAFPPPPFPAETMAPAASFELTPRRTVAIPSFSGTSVPEDIAPMPPKPTIEKRAQSDAPPVTVPPVVENREPTIPPIFSAVTPPASETVLPPEPLFESRLAQLEHHVENLQRHALFGPVERPTARRGWNLPKWGGRLYFDSVNITDQSGSSPEADGNIDNVFGLRELLFSATSDGFDAFSYRVELSYAPSEGVNVYDAWFGVRNVPLFNTLRFGNMKLETGFTALQSEDVTTLMEPGGPAEPFQSGRRVGLASIHHFHNRRARWMVGLFDARDMIDTRRVVADNQGWIVNTRLSLLPIFEQDGRRLLHLGASYAYLEPGSHRDALTIRPGAFYELEARRALRLGVEASACHKTAAELLWQRGPLGMAAEVYVNAYRGIGGERDRTAFGMYLEGRLFLSGDYRSYDLDRGTPGEVRVHRPFQPLRVGDAHLLGGFGGLEFVIQWNYADLTDWRDLDGRLIAGMPVTAGQENDLTLGLNWFWSPNIRWIFEYVHSRRDLCGTSSVAVADMLAASFRVHF